MSVISCNCTVFTMALEVLACAIKNEKYKTVKRTGEGETKISSFADNYMNENSRRICKFLDY